MPSLKDTKRRIVSVKNTQKITRAMKLVSSAKFARANNAYLRAQPYKQSLEKLLSANLPAASEEKQGAKSKTLVLVMAADRGLCGGLNANLAKFSDRYVKDNLDTQDISLVVWGRRAKGLLQYEDKLTVLDFEEKVLEKVQLGNIEARANKLYDVFQKQGFDRFVVLYSSFVNALAQVPKAVTVLPFVSVNKEDQKKVASSSQEPCLQSNTLVEPTREVMEPHLLKMHAANQLFNLALEAQASEQAARMTAMDNATNNADTVIKQLTLEYNRARQAAITTELIEITSGADALN